MSGSVKLSREAKEQILTSNIAITVKQLCDVMDISENPAYAAIKNGEFPSIRVGRTIKIPTAPLREMLHMKGAAK